MKQICYIFPGQGAQYVGMGKDLYDNSPEARKIIDEACSILPNVDIKRLCFQGPDRELTETANSQIAIFTVSIAALRALESKKKFSPVACAGLSLGEITSLVAAKSLEFHDGLCLVRKRGELMEEASRKNPGTMASILGFQLQELEKACKDGGSEVANLNCPGQIVISGTKESIERTIALALERGAKKAIPLNVNGPFHSSLMKEASNRFKQELDKVKFRAPEIKMLSNVTADFVRTPEEIKDNLNKQLYSPVRWEELIRKLCSEGIRTFFEIGPGKVLKGLLRRIDANLKVYNIEKVEDVVSLRTQMEVT